MKRFLGLILAIILAIMLFPLAAFAAKNDPPILIGGISVYNINSVGGVDVLIRWKNNSSKDIKYITFTVEPYNAVGDRVASSIGNKTTAYLEVTGPISPFNGYDFKDWQHPDWWGFYNKSSFGGGHDGWEIISKDMNGRFYYLDFSNSQWNPDIFDFTNEQIYLTEEESEFVMGQNLWGPIWYNNTIHEIKIIGVEVIWMDGTNSSYTGDKLSYICQTQPKPKDIH